MRKETYPAVCKTRKTFGPNKNCWNKNLFDFLCREEEKSRWSESVHSQFYLQNSHIVKNQSLECFHVLDISLFLVKLHIFYHNQDLTFILAPKLLDHYRLGCSSKRVQSARCRLGRDRTLRRVGRT